MPRVIEFILFSSLSNILTIFLPVLMILSTAGTVLFSEDGLFENIAVYEKILRFEKREKEITSINAGLKQEVYVLKSRKEKMLNQTLIEQLAAPKGAVIYRFTE
jgi:hypothetical protein